MPLQAKHTKPRHGAVAIIVEDGQFLVIRRSVHVRAPNLVCFAGGTIETGESPLQAIERELLEELHLEASAQQHVWQSVTTWGTTLEWILVERHPESIPRANEAEVAEWMWLSPTDLLRHPALLPSVPAFFSAWARADFQLPERAGQPDQGWLRLKW
jgi:8-oxo-dGTP diphosphatase